MSLTEENINDTTPLPKNKNSLLCYFILLNEYNCVFQRTSLNIKR